MSSGRLPGDFWPRVDGWVAPGAASEESGPENDNDEDSWEIQEVDSDGFEKESKKRPSSKLEKNTKSKVLKRPSARNGDQGGADEGADPAELVKKPAAKARGKAKGNAKSMATAASPKSPAKAKAKAKALATSSCPRKTSEKENGCSKCRYSKNGCKSCGWRCSKKPKASVPDEPDEHHDGAAHAGQVGDEAREE